MHTRHTILLLTSLSLPLFAQLPANYQLADDWLLSPTSYKASVTPTQDGNAITFGNGLFSRTISTSIGSTINYTNSMTGESIIRTVEPEGTLTIDGETYFLGGAKPLKNKAFLTKPWLQELSPLPNSLKLTNYEIGEPTERLKWKRVRHHEPDAKWPPAGKTLRLDYQFTPEALSASDPLLASDSGRKQHFSDDFTSLKKDWKIHATQSTERANFENEGKAGEIYTFPHTAVFAERPLPPDTALVEASINVGTDTSASWGPGIGLVFDNGKTIKLNIRHNDKHHVLGLFDGSSEHTHVNQTFKPDTTAPVHLRARIDGSKITFDARNSNSSRWHSITSLTPPKTFGAPKAFRVGKMARDGGPTDHDASGEHVRLKVENVAFYGPYKKPKSQASPIHPLAQLKVSVHYEIYDGIPAFSKWITLTNNAKTPINLDRFNLETLSVVEYENQVELRDGVPVLAPRVLHAETDMAFGGFSHRNANRHTVKWLTDKSYSTQVNYPKQTPCVLKVEPTFGPDQTIAPTTTFETFRMFQLVYDSEERERRGLALRKMYRTIAPWVTENPLMLHCKSSNEKVVKRAIDQAAETGFEMVILSFGSGFNSENDDPNYLAHWKKINDYALSKNIHLGSYSLYSSRSAGKGNDIIPPKGMRNAHGRCPAITSPWGQKYIAKLYNLFKTTGFMVFENDGTYPGDVDTTPRPPLQKGVNDSRWVHWRIWTDFYKFLRSRGVYFNLPDYYYLSGANKCGMGYREVNWSLPREQQRIITRQNIYDGTWKKPPSMGWMFVPLTQYHGGGAAATIEPLNQHLDHYEIMMKSNLGLGVQACYRGPRLYDTEATKTMVTNTVAWFKKHRDILESDLIHGRRADGIDLDWMLHVNPALEERALLSVYNPTDKAITKTIQVPLYYSGLQGTATYSTNGGASKTLSLDSSQRASLEVSVPANGYSYIIWKKN
ncbi:hypothetical protein [Rubritalea tangerina]|uniref:Alpha-galactosidase n=1 Tax=Rubritalea tangerina TaxID=430798 RepID=A0ABW4Z8N6_9BACT